MTGQRLDIVPTDRPPQGTATKVAEFRPSLLLGDEPTGHQDRARIDLVLTVLRQHAYNGAAVLITSHDQEVIGAADRVITLADGRIVSDSRTGTDIPT